VLQVQNVSPYSGLDASLRWSRPRDILSRYLLSKESAVPFMAPPVLNSFSICCTDIRTDSPVFWKIEWLFIISWTYLSIYIPFWRSSLLLLLPTKISLKTLFPRRQETAPERTRAAKYHRRKIINCSISSFSCLCYAGARISVYLFWANLDHCVPDLQIFSKPETINTRNTFSQITKKNIASKMLF